LEEAIYLTNFASKVSLLVRKDVFRASKAMQEKAMKNEKITIMWNTEAKELLGDAVLKQVKIVNNKTNEEKIIDASGVFYAI
jgi:thioredoxin reductase (NADPH)